MKIRFWCDVPDPCEPGGHFVDVIAGDYPGWSLRKDSRRFTFEVDFPVRSTADAEEVQATGVREEKQ